MKRKINKITKNKNGKYRYSGVLWAVFGIWAIYALVSQQFSLEEQKAQINEISENIQSEKEKNEELNHTLEQVGTDDFIIKYARKNLGFTMPNEQVFVDSTQTQK